jgi:ceramide glucosyltransferase
MSPVDLLSGLCAVIALVSIAYWFLSLIWLRAFFEEGVKGKVCTPPITFFRPLKAGVADLSAKLQAFLRETREEDQFLFGVEAGSVEARTCAELMRAFPTRDIAIIECKLGVALNPKIAKLLQMSPHARYDRWVVLDGEFVAEPGWLERFRCEWVRSEKDAFTAGYRFTGISTFLQALDAAPVLLTLWPGLGAVARTGQIGFMLGAVMALKRSDLETIGGWERFSEELAEDNRLGAALAGAGKKVGLSREVATLASDSLTWRDYWRHQRRIAVTYRICNPAGFAGMICTHGVSFAFLLVLLRFWSPAAWLLLGITLSCRLWTVKRLGVLLRWRFVALMPATLLASMIETICWACAWLSTSIWWAGSPWRIRFTRRGWTMSPK